jgi:branched-chain amino acid aminotransferase
VITPVGSVKHTEGSFTINGGAPGEVTMRLRDKLQRLQRGLDPDPHGWMMTLS